MHILSACFVAFNKATGGQTDLYKKHTIKLKHCSPPARLTAAPSTVACSSRRDRPGGLRALHIPGDPATCPVYITMFT